jgi:broad specificity phosphatase PhoE
VNTIVLVRHAETDLEGKICGHSDPEINRVGEQRLQSMAEKIVPLGIERIYSSDLRRAARTAIAIGERVGVAVQFRTGLREIHFGLWEGLSWEEIERKYSGEARLWVDEFRTRSAPGGETYPDFVTRVEAEFDQVIHDSETVRQAVVTHRGVMQYALTRYFGFSEAEAWQRTGSCGAIIAATAIETRPPSRPMGFGGSQAEDL